jgi:hypothetical protein
LTKRVVCREAYDVVLPLDESVALAKPFAPVVQKAAESFPDNKDIQSRGTFLQALFA